VVCNGGSGSERKRHGAASRVECKAPLRGNGRSHCKQQQRRNRREWQARHYRFLRYRPPGTLWSTGGVKGALGLAEDPARFSVACRQSGAIAFREPLAKMEEVFRESASLVFKHVRVVRIVDAKRNTLVYLTYADRLIDGHPDNAVTALPVLDRPIPLAAR